MKQATRQKQVTPPARRSRRGRPPVQPEALAAEHADARDEICNAALKLFEKGGVEAIGMRDIAKVLGVSAMMPYRYFPSKDHLLMELRLRSFQKLMEYLRRARRSGRDPQQALRKLCSAYLLFAVREPHAYRLMFDLWAFENPGVIKADFGEAVRRQSGAWLEMMGGVADYLTSIGRRTDVTTAAHIVWSTLHGAASLHLARKLVFDRSLRQLGRPVVESVLVSLNQLS